MKQIIVTDKQWNTIYTALKIEEVRNMSTDATAEELEVLSDIRSAIEAVQAAKEYKNKNK